MFIESLRLFSSKTGVLYRDIEFHQGTNFVVDCEDSHRHNKVGKTTFLKLIDVAMGAKHKSHIYTDVETNSITEELKSFIEDNKISLEMTLVKSLGDNSSRDKVVLRVDLFPNGRHFINGDKASQKRYRQELNALLFQNKRDVPKFRPLIHSFVRVSMSGDNNAFLQTSSNWISNAGYRAIYNFLFNISDPELDEKLGELRAEKAGIERAERRYKALVRANDPREQRQILHALEGDFREIKSQVDDIIDAEDFLRNREAISHVRNEYVRLSDQLADVDFKRKRNSKALEVAREELERQVDESLSRRFFAEVKSLVPSIDKTFSEMIEFNKKLSQNKINHFKDVEELLRSDYQQISQQRIELVRANSRYVSLVTENQIDEYESLTNRLNQIQSDIGQQQEIISTLEKFKAEKQSTEEQIHSFSEANGLGDYSSDIFQSRMDSFNQYFTPFAQRINGERPVLLYFSDDTKFPIGISELSGSSTGTRKSLIAAYDLAYQEFARRENLTIPKFIVHDVVENVEGDNLSEIVKLSNETNSQYIVAVLKEKLDSSGISPDEQERLKIIQLSTEDRLFERYKDFADGNT